MNLTEIIKDRILILDGAMGTMIQEYNLTEEDYRGKRFQNSPSSVKGNHDLLSITQPQIIAQIHTEYLEAGADLIETNTFNANAISMQDYAMTELVEELNIASVEIARKVADEMTKKTPHKPRFVLGALGPTNKTASISRDINDPGFRDIDFDTLATIYRQQAEAMLKTGVDALLVETVFDTLNAKAALFGIQDAINHTGIKVPLMVSGTITDKSGRTLSGQNTEAFLISLSHVDLFSIGLNCALGATELTPYLEVLAEKAPFSISVHPNAGLPNAFGLYDESPKTMSQNMKIFLDKNLVNIIGGCCGSTPEHIREIAALAQSYSPRKITA